MLHNKIHLLNMVSVLASTAQAHIALWDKGLFGLNYPGQATDSVQNYNNNAPVNPLREADALSQSQWFGHGFTGYPPAPGNYMTLPSGGTYNGELNCNRGGTSLRDPGVTNPLPYYACDGVGALHVMNEFNQTVDNQWFGGSALAIAYTSNVQTVQPNDFTVISVNHNTVWTRQVGYAIPAGMPPCPSGGCLCSWNWIHQADHGEGYPFEMYNTLYRCQVTGSTNAANVVQRGAVPVDCTSNPALCVKGPKTPMYIYQANGNNLPHLNTPPNYLSTWGFNDGAQTDIFSKPAAPAPTTYIVNPFATPTGTAAAGQPTPTQTTLPEDWISLGCQVDTGSPRTLPNAAYQQTTTNSYESCIAFCAKGAYKYAGVEYGDECWCSNEANLQSANATDCNSHCSGDPWAYCGGSWRMNVFLNVYTPQEGNTTATPTGTAVPSQTSSGYTVASPTVKTTGLPTGWSSLGCMADSGSPRTLNRGTVTVANVTANTCIAACSAQGWPYAGIEYGVECWCGDVANIVTAPASDCNSLCAGDSNSLCGGSWRLSLYGNGKGKAVTPVSSTSVVSSSSVVPTSKSSSSSVAVSKSSSTSVTPTSKSSSSSVVVSKSSSTSAAPSLSTSKVGTASSAPAPSSSSSSTIKASSTLSVTSSTVKTISLGSSLPSSTITKPVVSSTSSAAATASSSVSVSAPLPTGWATIGCYADGNPRMFTEYAFSASTLSPASCIAGCAAKGYTYAGAEFGYQCFCGSKPAYSIVRPSTECSVPCSGSATQMCGGSWRLNVYTNNATAIAAAKAAGTVKRDGGERVVRFQLDRDARRT